MRNLKILLFTLMLFMVASCNNLVVLEQTVRDVDVLNDQTIVFETKIYTMEEPSSDILILDTIVYDHVCFRKFDSVRIARINELMPRFKRLKDRLGEEYVPIIIIGDIKDGIRKN